MLQTLLDVQEYAKEGCRHQARSCLSHNEQVLVMKCSSGETHVLAAGNACFLMLVTTLMPHGTERWLEFVRRVRYLLEGSLMHTCAFAQVQQLCSRYQLVCFQLDIHLPYLTDRRRDEVTGQVRGSR